MNYDYLIWGHWQASSIALFFLLILIYYVIRQKEFGQENFSDARLKWFVVLVAVFAFYYMFIYNPTPNLIRALFLIPVTGTVNLSPHINAGPLTYLAIFAIIVLSLYVIYKNIAAKKSVIKAAAK